MRSEVYVDLQRGETGRRWALPDTTEGQAMGPPLSNGARQTTHGCIRRPVVVP
jgi:hypothetical protein